jgi:twitching motility protein PilT
VDVFPAHQQQQIKVQLSGVIEGVISQQLLETIDKNGRVCAMEIMTATPAIRNMIRDGKTHSIDSAVQTGMKNGMRSMDMALIELYRQRLISHDSMIKYCVDREMMERQLSSVH